MDKNSQIDLIPFVFFLSSVILINWSFDQTAAFYYLLLILFGMMVYRYDELKNLLSAKKKQTIYYPNLKFGG